MVEAKINRQYLLRMAGVALFMLGICVWSLYDATVAWPQKNQAFEQVRPALLATNLTAKAWLSSTAEDGGSPLDAVFRAKSIGTPSKLIKKIGEVKVPENLPPNMISQYRERQSVALRRIFEGDVYGQEDLQGQFVMEILTAFAALAAVLSFAGKLKRRFIAGDTALSGSGFGGTPIDYADIESIDWQRWDKKDIVKVSVKGGAVYKLDGWHFAGISAVVEKIVEQRPDLKA